MKQLFNIFSKRKTKPVEKQKIIVDYREKNSLVVAEITSLGCDIEFRQLKVADYLVGGVAVERKTISDFINSMINHRLSRQLEEMQQYENRLLIVEGMDEQELYTDESQAGMHPNSVRGFLLSILLKYRVPIIFTKNYSDTACFLSVLSKRKSKEMSLNVNKKSLNKNERMQFILEGFPGIGPKTARKLLKKFKSVPKIINASPEELREAIGKKADAVIRILSQKY